MTLSSVGKTILDIHAEIHEVCPRLSRIAIAIYDPATGLLKTFADSTEIGSPLSVYQAPLSEVPSLQELADSGQARVIDDLDTLNGSASEHTRKMLAAGYRSSFTVPLFFQEQFLGFVFFDSLEKAYFTRIKREHLMVYARFLAAALASQLRPVRSLSGAVRHALFQNRDEATAGQLACMANYARLIAKWGASKFGLRDEYIEYLYQFAPLRDIGTLAIPEHLLLKPGHLDQQEYRLIKTHVCKGREIARVMVRRFHLQEVQYLSILENVIQTHHERFDGSGYPRGLMGYEIPLEGRIVGVADVLVALTSERPYRKARSFDWALGYLAELRGIFFDPDCVEAVLDQRGAFRQVAQLCTAPD